VTRRRLVAHMVIVAAWLILAGLVVAAMLRGGCGL